MADERAHDMVLRYSSTDDERVLEALPRGRRGHVGGLNSFNLNFLAECALYYCTRYIHNFLMIWQPATLLVNDDMAGQSQVSTQ